MLNGKNWWTNPSVAYEYAEDFNNRIEDAAKMVWKNNANQDGDIKGLYDFIDAVKQVLNAVNNTKPNQEKTV